MLGGDGALRSDDETFSTHSDHAVERSLSLLKDAGRQLNTSVLTSIME